MAFIDMGDQFVALARGRTQPPDQHRHFGLVVDDKEAVRARLQELGIPVSSSRGLDFRDGSAVLFAEVAFFNELINELHADLGGCVSWRANP